MKNFTALILAGILVSASIIASPILASGEISAGVKKGYWIEYNISITGPPLDPLRNLTWYRADILEVDGASFQANKTALSVNGTLSSSIWNFSLAEGQVQGWVIIPANLSMGDAFFDAAKSANITIEGEGQKTVLGTSRTITHASNPGKVYKEWDKATGVYVHAIEHTTNYTVITNAIATNMWSPQTRVQNPTASYQLVAAAIILAVITILLFSVMFRKKSPETLTQENLTKHPSLPSALSQGFLTKNALRLRLSRLYRCEMKAFTALVLVSLIVSVSIITSPAFASVEPSVGVKEGDWIEYNISVSGTGTPPPTHDVRWMRMEVLPVQGAAFSVNLTARYANGTLGSAIWKFNFTEGNLEGWIIIPSNLAPGDTFYDSSMHNRKPVNVTIQSQEQKTVLGASRTVTYGNDSLRHKEWDKATGVFVGSSEHLKNVTNRDGWYIEDLTVNVQAVATNIWSPQIQPDQTTFYALVAGITVLAVSVSTSVIVIERRKRRKKL